MAKLKSIGYCPHCGNTVPQEMVYAHRFQTYVYHPDGTKTDSILPASYFIATCGTCNNILVYYGEVETINNDDFLSANLVYPKTDYLSAKVPEVVRNCYSEAFAIKRIAPNAFATQIRRAIEAVCDDRKINPGTLAKRIKALSDKGEVPPLLAEMTDFLRVIGNIGAHNKDQNVKPIQVDAIDEFFRAIIEYVYIAPAKLETFKRELARFQ